MILIVFFSFSLYLLSLLCFFWYTFKERLNYKRTGEHLKDNFTYPMNIDWTTEELIKVMGIWQAVETAYESKIEVDDFMMTYKAFKEVVKSIGEERQLGREFEELTGYSLYKVVQLAKKRQTGVIKRKDLIDGK